MENNRYKPVYHNGIEIGYIIDKEKDIIIFDMLSVFSAGLTVENFLYTDAFLDIVSEYKRLTGRPFTIDYIQVSVNNKKVIKHIVS